MTWNYRIIFHDEADPPYYGLHEIYYNKETAIYAWTSKSTVVGDDKEEIISSLKMMLKDAENSDVLSGKTLEANIKDM